MPARRRASSTRPSTLAVNLIDTADIYSHGVSEEYINFRFKADLSDRNSIAHEDFHPIGGPSFNQADRRYRPTNEHDIREVLGLFSGLDGLVRVRKTCSQAVQGGHLSSGEAVVPPGGVNVMRPNGG